MAPHSPFSPNRILPMNNLLLPADPQAVVAELHATGYVADEALATSAFLLLHLGRPLLLEGPSGVGKTELAQALATLCQTELIRLQCYEGLDVHSAVYEWNYQKQLLPIVLPAKVENQSKQNLAQHLF